MNARDVAVMICPRCSGGLNFRGREPEDMRHGVLQCYGCGSAWPVVNALPHLFDADRVRGRDRFLRFIYDRIAPFHDLGVRFALPLMQLSSGDVARDGYMKQLDLGSLGGGDPSSANGDGDDPPIADRDDSSSAKRPPIRILEVGIGAGANLELIERDVPTHLDYEVWGVDLSPGMLAQCQWRLWWTPRHARRVRLMLADAHHLPFANESFDRVFHVGGINGYGDPRVALEEMARVARPGTPIVVVDEQLDRAAAQNPYYWLLFRAMTLYDRNPQSPRALLPDDAVVGCDSQVSRFYYCLSFRMPASNNGASSAARPSAARLLSRARATAPQENVAMPTIPRTNVNMMKSDDIKKLRGSYTEETMNEVLSTFFPAHYPVTGPYINTIEAAFYTNVPKDDGPGPRAKLSAADRERCLIAILASRGNKLTLAIHIYIALMNGVTAGEIAHILFLNGIYTGVDNLSFSLGVQTTTLEVLNRLAADDHTPVPGPRDVVRELNVTFSPPPPPPPEKSKPRRAVNRGAAPGRTGAASSRPESLSSPR